MDFITVQSRTDNDAHTSQTSAGGMRSQLRSRVHNNITHYYIFTRVRGLVACTNIINIPFSLGCGRFGTEFSNTHNLVIVPVVCGIAEVCLKIFKGSLQTLPPIPCWAGFDWMKLTSGWWVVRPETLLRKETFCWWCTWSSVQEQVGSWGISGAKSTLLSGKRMARLLYKIAVLIVCSLNCWTRSYWNLVLIMVFDHPFPEFFFCELHFLRPNGTHVRMYCCRLRHLEK